MIKVSVIVPVYNVEKHLTACLNSILNQTFTDFELILVNDGSIDNSKEICETFALKDERIILLNKENGGLSNARNTGLSKAIGKYICFLDSDDWFDPKMLEHYYQTAHETNADIIVSGIKVEYENENYIIEKNVKNMICTKNFLAKGILECERTGLFNPVCNKFYKRNILLNSNIFFEADGVPAEDLLFNCTVFQNINTLVLLDKAYYHYMRRNEETLVTKYYEDLYTKVKKIYKG